jgi:pimeloyl-ACP methyl ester carboxylesterase
MPVVDRATTDAVVAGVGAWIQASPSGRQEIVADPVPGSARALVAHATRGRSSRLLVIPEPEARAAAVPRTEADVLAVVADQYPGAGQADRLGAAQVAVERLDHADGSRSWVVAIPGTETGSANGPNPLDGLTDLQLIARTPDDVSALVARAMDQAGIAPGDAVLLAGHSLGGIVAASMAADPAITSRYRIAAVITAGAPVSGETVPSATAALHLEHAQDSVPGLRGLPNPDELNRTTVVRDLSASDDPAERAIDALGDAHSVQVYVRTAELLPHDDPSVIGFRSSLAEVLGPDVVAASTRTFAAIRVPLDGCTP